MARCSRERRRIAVIAKAPVAGRSQDAAVPAVHARAGRARWPRRRCRTRSPRSRARRGAPPGRSCSTARRAVAPPPASSVHAAARRRPRRAARRAPSPTSAGRRSSIGMDTPQVTPALLAERGSRAAAPRPTPCSAPRPTAATGRSACARPTPRVFAGVPMSTGRDAARRSARGSRASGCATAELPPLRDVDDDRRRPRRRRARPARRFARARARRWPARGADRRRAHPSTRGYAARSPGARSSHVRLPGRACRRCRSTAGSARSTAADETVLDRARGAGPRRRLRPGPARARARPPRRARRSASTSRRVAVALARRRGAPAIEASVFGRVPGAGTWGRRCCSTATSGSAATRPRCSRRLARPARPGGDVLVELERARASPTPRPSRASRPATTVSDWFPWARVGADALDGARAAAGSPSPSVDARGGGSPAARGRPSAERLGRRRRSTSLDAELARVGPLRAGRVPEPAAHRAHRRDPRDRARRRVPHLLRDRARLASRPAPARRRLPLDARAARRGCTASRRACTSRPGIAAIPLLLAKLWTVYPQLFTWPPVQERRARDRAASLVPLVAGCDLPALHRPGEHRPLVPVGVRLHRRPLLDGVDRDRRARRPHRREARRSPAARCGARRRRRPRRPSARPATGSSRRGFLGDRVRRRRRRHAR